MIEQILLMCAIIALTPVEVDCDTQWVVIQDDRILVEISNGKGIAVYDYELYPITDYYDVTKEFENKRWIAVADLVQDNCWAEEMTEPPSNCIPLIWHEIKHQVCTCNWHENLVQTFKSFKNVFGGIA